MHASDVILGSLVYKNEIPCLVDINILSQILEEESKPIEDRTFFPIPIDEYWLRLLGFEERRIISKKGRAFIHPYYDLKLTKDEMSDYYDTGYKMRIQRGSAKTAYGMGLRFLHELINAFRLLRGLSIHISQDKLPKFLKEYKRMAKSS